MGVQDPDQVAFDDVWGRLWAYARGVWEETSVPALAIGLVWVRPGKTSISQTMGVGARRVGMLPDVDGDTVFPLASVSKPLASTVVARLVGQDADANGKLGVRWDAAVGVPEADTPLAKLFAHRSGLPDHAGDAFEDLGADFLQVRDLLPKLALAGMNYAYTNFGLTAGAQWAAGRAGKSWEDLCDDLLYRPLEMLSTSSRYLDPQGDPKRAWGHQVRSNDWVVADPQRNPTAQSPAGGVSSSANDLTRWLRLQLGERFAGFEESFFRELDRTHQAWVGTEGYGLGWIVGTDKPTGGRRWSHSGGFNLGASTAVSLLPDSGFGVVALTNGQPIGTPEAICAALSRFLADPSLDAGTLLHDTERNPFHPTGTGGTLRQNFQDMFREELFPPSKHEVDTPEPSRVIYTTDGYEGTYTSDVYGTLTVRLEAGRLYMEVGPEGAQKKLWLTPSTVHDIFLYDAPGENGAANVRVSFRRNSGLAVHAVKLWNLALSYPMPVDGRPCMVAGEILAFRVKAKSGGTIRLVLYRGTGTKVREVAETKLLLEVFPGFNQLVVPPLPVEAGDTLAFEFNGVKGPNAEVEVEADIDREGTFTR